jgi:uncharacterized membrane protein
MTLMNPIFITLIAACPFYIIIGWVMLKVPPKWGNTMYGYRTVQSKSTIEKWNFSQPYSAIQFIKSGLIGCCLAIAGLFVVVQEGIGVAVGLSLLAVLTIYPIYKTERAMKQKFGK